MSSSSSSILTSSSSSITRPQQSLRLKLRTRHLSSSSPKHAPTNTWLVLFILLFCTDYGHATPLRRAAFNYHEPRQLKTNDQKNAGAGGHAVAEEKIKIPGKLVTPPVTANGDHQGFVAAGKETGGLKKAPFPNGDRNVSAARIAVGETPVHYSTLSTTFLPSSSVLLTNVVATTASTMVVTGLGKTSLNTSVLSTTNKKTETARIVPPALSSSHTRVESASSSGVLSIHRTTASTSLASPASRYNVTSGFSPPTSTPVMVPTHSVSRVLDHTRLFPTRALNSSTILSSTSARKTSSTIPSPITTGFGLLNSTKTVPAPMRHGHLAPSSSNSSSFLSSMTRSTSHSTDTSSSSSGPMTTQSSSVGSKSSTATSRSRDGTTTSSRASKSRAERTSSHPSPSKSLKTTEHGSKTHQALKATNTEKSTSSKGIAPIPTAAHHHHELMSKKTETLVGAIIGSILALPVVPAIAYYSVRSFWNLIAHGHHPFDGRHWGPKEDWKETHKQIAKDKAWDDGEPDRLMGYIDDELRPNFDKQLTRVINSFRPPGAPQMHGLTAANLKYLIELHPSELAPPKGKEDWYRRGRVDAPEVGSSADLPGGAELVVQPDQAVELPEGGYVMEFDEDGTFLPLMSGAIQREPITGGPVENPGEEFREAGKKVVVKLSEKEETAKFRTPQKMRILPASILKVKPPGDKPLKVICQKIDNFFEKGDNWIHDDGPIWKVSNPFRKADKGIYAHDRNDYHTKRSDPDIDVPRRVRRHSRVRRDQIPMIQFVEWDENHDGQPPAPVGPKPPTTVHEYVAQLFKYRAELEAQNLLEAQNYTASLLEAAKKKFLIEQAAKLFVESLQKAEAEKKTEADKKAKAEQNARDKAAAEKKAEQDAREKVEAEKKLEQDARDKAAAEKKAKEEKEAKEKAEAERKRKEQQDEERKRKQEEDRRARQEYEDRKRRQEEERKRKKEEEDRRRRQEEEDRRKEEERKRKVLEEWQRRHWEKEQERRMAEKCKLNGFNWVFGHIGKWLHVCHGPECYCW